MIDVVIPSDGCIRKKEHEKLEKHQALSEELEKMRHVEGNSGPCGDQNTRASDPKNLRVVPADSRNDIQDLCPEACSPGNS